MGFFSGLFGPSKLQIEKRFDEVGRPSRGTMSRVLIVKERETGKVFALKLLDMKAVEQFESKFKGLSKPTEVEIATKLKHPRLVATLESGTTNTGQTYLLMECCGGRPLNYLIGDKDPALDGKRLPIIRQMAEGLQALHEAGFMHRDVCPDNYMVDCDGPSVKLIDFGLSVPATKDFMTAGNRTGKADYMAPELLRRHPTDHRVDIFAFGMTCFELLAGEMPWNRGGADRAMQRATEVPPSLRERVPGIDPTLADAVEACMQVDPGRRPESLKDFLRRIRPIKHEMSA